MPIDKSAISKEMVAKAMQCKNADELMGGGFCYTDCRSVCGDYVEFMNG